MSECLDLSKISRVAALAAESAQDGFESRLCEEINRRLAITPAMLHSIDEQGLLISVSDAWLAKLGYAREEVLGRRSTDFLTPESRERAIRDVVPNFFQTGRCDNVQYQMVKKDGEIVDVLMSAVLADNPSGEGQVSLAVMTDVTALLETRRQLRESEAKYRSLVEEQTDLVALISTNGQLRYANRAYAAFCGLQAEEMVGRSLYDFVPEDEHAGVGAHLKRVSETGESIEVENQVILPSGEKRWVGWTNRALTDDEGRITVIHSVGRDIQARVDAERHVQESEARYRFLAENSTDLILLVDSHGKRIYASPASRKLLGYEPEEAVAMQLREVIHPEDAPRVLPVLAGQPGDTLLTYRMRRKDGSYVWVETTGKTVEIANGERQRLIIVRDIQERMKAEERLAEANRRLQALASTDGLTGLANRRTFNETLAKEYRRARREGGSVALIMIDVDRFKAFNDRYGHPVGDECLRDIAEAISKVIRRPGDIAARYGGEEFSIVLPATDEAGAMVIARSIREAVLRLQIEHTANETGLITVSAGVAAFCPDMSPASEEALLREADRALYLAKNSGRNTIASASPTSERSGMPPVGA